MTSISSGVEWLPHGPHWLVTSKMFLAGTRMQTHSSNIKDDEGGSCLSCFSWDSSHLVHSCSQTTRANGSQSQSRYWSTSLVPSLEGHGQLLPKHATTSATSNLCQPTQTAKVLHDTRQWIIPISSRKCFQMSMLSGLLHSLLPLMLCYSVFGHCLLILLLHLVLSVFMSPDQMMQLPTKSTFYSFSRAK